MSEDVEQFKRDMVEKVDLSAVPEPIAKQLRLLRDRPDLMWLEDDSEEERTRKQVEFDALLLAREPKH